MEALLKALAINQIMIYNPDTPPEIPLNLVKSESVINFLSLYELILISYQKYNLFV